MNDAPPMPSPLTATPQVDVVVCALPLLAAGLASLMAGVPQRLRVLSTRRTLAELTPQEREGVASPVILVDLDNDLDWEALEGLLRTGNQRVLAMSASSANELRERAILLGARGVLTKEESPELLFKAIERVAAGEIWMDRDTTGRIFMQLVHGKTHPSKDPVQERISLLTKRERQVVRLFSKNPNLHGKQLAALLEMSEHTMRNHLTAIYTKLELANRVDLFAFAQRHSAHL